MSPKHPPLTPEDAPFDDIDSPEWTQADFEAAVGPDDLSPIELAAFPKTRPTRIVEYLVGRHARRCREP